MLPSPKIMSGEATCSDIIQCLYNLNEFEVELYWILHEEGEKRADDLADRLKKDRSTVYRSLQKLVSCGMCFRESRTIERGGHYHVYSAIPSEDIKAKAEECADNWYASIKQALDNFNPPHKRKGRKRRK